MLAVAYFLAEAVYDATLSTVVQLTPITPIVCYIDLRVIIIDPHAHPLDSTLCATRLRDDPIVQIWPEERSREEDCSMRICGCREL